MTLRTTMVAVLVALALGAAPVTAQREAPAAGERAALEQRVRERLARVVRQRLGLNDEQMRKLQATNRKFERQRVDLVRQEREARVELRTELADVPSADQQKVGALVDRMLRLQRQRLDLLEAEQKELSAFMTPVQRAQYLALQDQLRRRLEEARRRGAGRGPGGGPQGERPF